MTTIDAAPRSGSDDTDATPSHEAQLLFREAKQRQRRRWLVAGIVSLVLLLFIGLTLGLVVGRGGGGSVKPTALPASAIGAGHPHVNLTFRPALCYAPPFALASGQAPSTGPLPSCSPSSALTASNLSVTPQSGNVNGYSVSSSVPEDPQFATYPSTVPARVDNGSTVLLPGTAAMGTTRYVLGPAAVTSAAIQSATTQHVDGQWLVDVVFTPRGSERWDAFAIREFHQIIGVDLNGQVISAPITQPTQSSFSLFNGQVQISGSFTQAQAKRLASEL